MAVWRYGDVVVVVVLMVAAARANAAGESVPEMTIQNRFSGCFPQVECEPYEDKFLHLKENYYVIYDANPSKTTLTCTVQCRGDNATTHTIVSFVGAVRGTSTKYFQWRINPDGGYVRWLDAKQKVIKKFTKMWSF